MEEQNDKDLSAGQQVDEIFQSKMMNSVLKTMNFVFKLMDFVLKMTGWLWSRSLGGS